MAAVRPGTRGRRNMPDLNLEEEDDWVLRPGESEADYSSRLMSTAAAERPSKKKHPASTAQDEESGSGKSAMDQEVINKVDEEVKKKRGEGNQERFGPWRCPWSGCRKDYMKVSETYVRAHMKKHYESRAVEQRLIAAREAESLAAREAESLAAGEAEKRQDRALSSQRKKKSQREKTSTDAQAVRAEGAHAGKPEESVTEAGKPQESVTEAGKPEESVTEAGKPEESVTEAGKPEEWVCPICFDNSKIVVRVSHRLVTAHMQRFHFDVYKVEERERLAASKPEESVTEAGKPETPVTDAGKLEAPVIDAGNPEESVADAEKLEAPVADAGKPEESVTVGSGKLAMNQEMNIPNFFDDEEILQRVLHYKLEGVDDSFMWEGAEEKERRAMVKAIQERMAMAKKALFHWQHKLPTNDQEFWKVQAPVTRADKLEESPIHQEVTVDDKETLEQVLEEKLDILDIEEVSNRTTKPAADPNSMTIQNDHLDRGKSALAKKTAEEEAQVFAEYRSSWEWNCCKDCDHFDHITVLSSMQYTHYTPGMVPFNMVETLQIFSIKLKLTDDNAGGFELPLSVYGMVAVRDTVDSRRNILFSCGRTRAQELTHDDPFLHLTGPSRAIVSADRVYFEMMLKVKGAAASQDKLLIAYAGSYNERISTLCFDNLFCTLELFLQTVKEAVQATIVGVQMINKEESWPLNFKYGGQVACTPLPRPTYGADSGGDQKIVVIESRGTEMLQGDSGYVHLWRQVVSVEHGGGLDVIIQAYKKSGAVHAEGRVHFTAQSCNISQQQCIVGQAQVTVTVAWSIVPTDMDDVLFNDV